MRVALFFDGKNHMKDLRRTAQDRWLDHGALADWIVRHVGGTAFAGAYYYTGVPTAQDDTGDRHALTDLLEELEKRPGFFVRRFNRRATTRECPHCAQVISYTEEKMVDTSLAVDLVMLAHQDAFDVAVVFTGDLDVSPALTALRSLGKQAWIATFGDFGLSRSLLREAWSHVDLLAHLDAFAYPELAAGGAAAAGPAASVAPPEDVDREIVRELKRAEAHFAAGGGFVGAHYFLHRWKGHAIPDGPEARRIAVQRLMGLGRIETYSVDGKTALRVAPSAIEEVVEAVAAAGIDDEETTVEMRLSDTVVRRLRTRQDE
jgi:uncharacterized LabA/DUF88 family protein